MYRIAGERTVVGSSLSYVESTIAAAAAASPLLQPPSSLPPAPQEGLQVTPGGTSGTCFISSSGCFLLRLFLFIFFFMIDYVPCSLFLNLFPFVAVFNLFSFFYFLLFLFFLSHYSSVPCSCPFFSTLLLSFSLPLSVPTCRPPPSPHFLPHTSYITTRHPHPHPRA